MLLSYLAVIRLDPVGDAMVSLRKPLPALFVGLVLVYLYAPIAVIVLFSVTTSPRLSMPIEGFTLSWYAERLFEPADVDGAEEQPRSGSGVRDPLGHLRRGLLLRSRRAEAGEVRTALLAASLLPAVVPLARSSASRSRCSSARSACRKDC